MEHRLQLLFDLQTHRLPETTDELRKLALRMGYSRRPRIAEPAKRGTVPRPGPRGPSCPPRSHSPLDEPSLAPTLDARDLLLDPLDRFLHDFNDRTRLNRTILDHLLHQTFADSPAAAEPESDLILEPEPDDATVAAVLGRYGFRDVPGRLAEPDPARPGAAVPVHPPVPALPGQHRAPVVAGRRRHDRPGRGAEQPGAGDGLLGGKAVLYELFSFNPPSLKLYVDLCDSPFLSQMLINNPGMIDDLLDSLMLNRPRDLAELRAELAELLRGAGAPDAVESILHSFQDKEVLRIAVRDLLGKDDVRAVTAALSDVAEALLVEVAAREEAGMRERFGGRRAARGPRPRQARRAGDELPQRPRPGRRIRGRGEDGWAEVARPVRVLH